MYIKKELRAVHSLEMISNKKMLVSPYQLYRQRGPQMKLGRHWHLGYLLISPSVH